LGNFKGTVLMLYADNPLLTKETIAKLLKYHAVNNCAATLLTASLNKPRVTAGYCGNKYSAIRGIVEEKDADDSRKR